MSLVKNGCQRSVRDGFFFPQAIQGVLRILVVFQESPGIGRIGDGQIVLVWRVTRTKGRLSNSSESSSSFFA